MIVERSMDPRWLSNAYLVADRSSGTAVFIDSGAPVSELRGGGRAPGAPDPAPDHARARRPRGQPRLARGAL